MTIRRFSSRIRPLDQSFLAEHLQGARSYRRIAGYFTSSLFEIAHEWLEPIPDVRIVCNVDLTPEDLKVAQRGQVIRVAPDSLCGFLHGKAGVIELADGRRLGFIGSMNETRHAWQRHYEILWEDDSPEGVAWIEAEFEFLWNAARPLVEDYPAETIGLYAGADRSRLYRDGQAVGIVREELKRMVATDAACEASISRPY